MQRVSTSQLERLAMLAEEAGEVVQAVTKILRHGMESYDPTLPTQQQISNRQHLVQELQELNAVVRLMITAGDVTSAACAVPGHVINRKQKWMHNQ